MKIIQSIFTTLFLSNRHSDRELLFAAITRFKKAHRGEFQSAGSYSRKLFSPGHFDYADEDTDITLPRIRLKKGFGDENDSPSSTHTITADILIPNSSYSIRAVLTVLYAGLHWEGTIEKLCQKYHIAPSTYYTWKRLFEAHCASWNRSLMESTKLCDDLNFENFRRRALLACGSMTLKTVRYTIFDEKNSDPGKEGFPLYE